MCSSTTLKAVMPFEDAKTSMAKWDPQQRQLELGQRAINRYGCFSCHDIKGFEKAQSIGTDLSEEGSKLVTRLDFSFVSEIPHTSKLAWFKTKLHDPRIFDRGRELLPLEKLRMPNWDFTDDEVDRLVTAIMSFQREIQPPAALPMRSARYDSLVSGRTLVNRRNCVGCHIIETTGGEYLKLVADSSLGPPRLTPEGARVQPDWLYAFLRGPIPIRPWLDVRMPTFGLDDQNLNYGHPVLRIDLELDRTVPDPRNRARQERGSGRQGAVRIVEVPAMSRAGRDSEGSADGESGARSPDGARAAESGLDRGVAEGPGQLPSGHAHAGVLARLSEVAVSAAGRRRGGPDPRHPRPPDDVQGRPVAEEERRFGSRGGDELARATTISAEAAEIAESGRSFVRRVRL